MLIFNKLFPQHWSKHGLHIKIWKELNKSKKKALITDFIKHSKNLENKFQKNSEKNSDSNGDFELRKIIKFLLYIWIKLDFNFISNFKQNTNYLIECYRT